MAACGHMSVSSQSLRFILSLVRTHFRKQPISALCFESENELKSYNLEAWSYSLTFSSDEVFYYT